MYVKDYMSTNLITIQPHIQLIQCQDLMRRHNINRLPVLDGDKLVGLITSDGINKSLPSDASSLDAHEVNYLLAKATAGDVMFKKVVSVQPDCLLDEAASLMIEKNIGALIVLEEEKLIGIITDKDIFRAFIDISGHQTPGTTLVLELAEDRLGVVEEVGKAMTSNQINITHMMVYHLNGLIRIVIHVQATEVADLVADLEAYGLTVKGVI